MKMIKEKHISCKFKANAEMQDLRRLLLQESKYEVVTDGIQLTGLIPPHVWDCLFCIYTLEVLQTVVRIIMVAYIVDHYLLFNLLFSVDK